MEKKKIVVTLAGNPNCGKTSIFNSLTGLRRDVSNYPGATVEKVSGFFEYQDYVIEVIDLPGTYSLSAYSEDERVSRHFLIYDKPDIVVNVLDASNLERNLYLTIQLLELEVPVILAMNMSDMVMRRGFEVDYQELSKVLNSPVVPTVGDKGAGINELKKEIVRLFEKCSEACPRVRVDYGPEIFDEIQSLETLLREAEGAFSAYPSRWIAIKLLEQDPQVIRLFDPVPSRIKEKILNRLNFSREHLKAHFGEAAEVMIADRRYGFISGIIKTVRTILHQRDDISDAIDRVVLNRVLGFPIFAFIMFLIFKFTFAGAAPFIGWLSLGFERLAGFIAASFPENIFRSLIIDALINGVGSLLEFLPLIMFMFLAIAFFEDSGYMARAAFLMDKFMARFGLHGKSFLPLMISTNGCAVLGIMASRTLENSKDRLITMLITPFMICGAKLPVFAIFIAAFFPENYAAFMMFLLYFFSISVALASAWILRQFVFKGEVEHFVMELPPYRFPSIRGVFLKTWERGVVYLKKAGTVILFISVIIWAGFSFPIGAPVNERTGVEQSAIGRLGRAIEPVLKPLGLDWRAGTALVSGVAAKEVIISTFGTIYSLQDGEEESLEKHLAEDPFWDPLKAFSFLIFSLLYTPCCVSAVVFFKEAGSWRWTLFLMFGTALLAWIVSFVFYQAGLLLLF
ncbi:MAG: ferrous iron transport protein B [Candidatus Omnitrophota bacterium]